MRICLIKMRTASTLGTKLVSSNRRTFWKMRSVPKHVQPVVEQVKPIIHETLKEVYAPLLEKLSSIDNRLENIETYVEKYAPKYVKTSGDKTVQLVDPKDIKRSD